MQKLQPRGQAPGTLDTCGPVDAQTSARNVPTAARRGPWVAARPLSEADELTLGPNNQKRPRAHAGTVSSLTPQAC